MKKNKNIIKKRIEGQTYYIDISSLMDALD